MSRFDTMDPTRGLSPVADSGGDRGPLHPNDPTALGAGHRDKVAVVVNAALT
jgi:hypothetical protein